MKKISIVCLTGLLFLTACDNSGSSTVGTYEKEETSQSSEKSESNSNKGLEEKTERATEKAAKGSGDTTVKMSGDESGAEIKTGSNVSADTTHKMQK
ncbi:MAG: hypothetical protein M3040_06675 [Bacteroidota bacterium]|nr:hypothetical protein [Bacteroidota bacterium]